MKRIVTKLAMLILTIFLSMSIYSLSKVNINATEDIEYIKITVDDYYGHEEDYLKKENKRYVVCGIIYAIYLYKAEYDIHGFCLNSMNPLCDKEVYIYCKMDSYKENNVTTYDGHFVYYGSLSASSACGKYIEILLDEDSYTSEITDSSKSRGHVYCDATNSNLTVNENLHTAINSYKTNTVKSSMRFNYDFIPSSSDSSTSTWTQVTNPSEITGDGVYALGKLYDEGRSVRFVVTPKGGYTSGEKFDYSIARIEDSSFTIVYPNQFPTEFKLVKHEDNPYYDLKLNSTVINNYVTFDNAHSARLWTSTTYGDIIIMDDETETSELYLFKRTNTGASKDIHIEYYPNSVALRFLSYINSEDDYNIKNDTTLIDDVTYGMILSIDGRDDQYVDFTAEEISRVESAGSNTAVLEGGVLQTILKIKGIPMENWNTEVTVTPYIKISFNSYVVPSDNETEFNFDDVYFYQASVTKTVASLAEDYYLNHGTEDGVSYHLIALKEIAELTAKVKEDK